MRTSRHDGLRWIGAAIGAALLAAATTPALGEAGRVTGIAGAVSVSGDRALAQNSELAADERVETGGDGNVAMLVGDDIVVELCPSSALVIEKEVEGRHIVRVEAGDARIVVQPGQQVPIEIHTPAAIATILGTVIYVTVDPATGETTITSSDHDVEVKGVGPTAAPPMRITGGQRTTVPWGGDPGEPQRLGFSSMQNLGDCLGGFDRRLKTLAVIQARGTRMDSIVMQTAIEDMLVGEDLPAVAGAPTEIAPSGAGQGPREGLSPIEDVELPFDPTNVFDTGTTPGGSRTIADCTGPPGEHCSF